MDPDRREAVERIAQAIERGFEYNGQPLGPHLEFEALPLATWIKRPKPPYEELLGPLVVRGQRLVLGAATGEGKSTLIWWIVKALSVGGRFLDWTAQRPCRVLVVDAEQSDHDLERLITETHLGEAENVWLVHVPDGLSLNSSEEERQRLELFLSEGQFDVVVLDPLYKLHTGDPNDEREAVGLMKLFDRWRTTFNFALVVPSHMRKPDRKLREQDFSMHEIFGASAYLRGAETVIGIRLISEGISRLYFFKSRGPGLPVRTSWPLRYQRDTGFSIFETPVDKIRREADADDAAVRGILIQAGGAGVEIGVIIEALNKGRSTVFNILKRLGAVTIPMPGNARKKLYMLPDVEPDQLEAEVWSFEDDPE